MENLRFTIRETARGLLPIVLALSVQVGCVTTPDPASYYDHLVIDNSSPDLIRVLLVVGGRELRLGRIQAMSRRELAVQPGIAGSGSNARIRVIPVGARRLEGLPGNGGSLEAYSELYAIDALILSSWRYTGKQVLWTGSRGANRRVP